MKEKENKDIFLDDMSFIIKNANKEAECELVKKAVKESMENNTYPEIYY